MQYLFDIRPERPGYRLQRLEMFNWGTFDSSDGHVFRFEPAGRTALMVGHNGSGKSTVVDAILTLLVEPRIRNYNVAAGARKTERTEKSYIRGAFARTSDEASEAIVKYLRPQGARLTALAAVFGDEQLGRSFTLCQVLHLTSDGTTDKLFAICDEARELSRDLAGVRQADDIARHLEGLGYQTTKRFVQYRSWLVRRTKMLPKAMEMLNQTVAVKDIQSLNDFIRRHMLERHDWQEKISRLLGHFHDLSVAHQELVRARKAVELLEPVERQGVKFRQQAEAVASFEAQLRAAGTFFRAQTVKLVEPTIARHRQQLAEVEARLERIGDDQEAAAEQMRQLKNQIDQTGGDHRRALDGLLAAERSKLAVKHAARQRFEKLLDRAGMDRVPSDQDEFDSLRDQLQRGARQASAAIDRLQAEQDQLVAQRAELGRLHAAEQAELDDLDRRATAVPPALVAVRSQLCESLGLREEELPFAAELMDMDPSAQRWQAAVEAVLRPMALALLVPAEHQGRVQAYVDRTLLTDRQGRGQRLAYLPVPTEAPGPAEPGGADALVAKLRFHSRHPLARWLRGEIARRYPYRCCETFEQFQRTRGPAMTIDRHLRHEGDRHAKDDRPQAIDPRHYVLGWDNRNKRALVAERIETLAAQQAELDRKLADHRAQLADLRRVYQAHLDALETVDFETIDLVRHERQLASLVAEQKQLDVDNSAMQVLNRRLAEVSSEVHRLRQQRDEANKQLALLSKENADGERQVAEARRAVDAVRAAGEYAEHEASFAAIAASLPGPLTADSLPEVEATWTAHTRQQVERLRGPHQALGERLVESMSRYLREFKEEQSDLDASLQSLDSFLGLLAQLRQEDLPRHEQKFKQRLNENVTQEMALFHASLREERRRIEEKIAQLNKALGQLEYRPGTSMRLEPRRVQDREIEDFRRSLAECLDESLDGGEASEARFQRIEKLVARLADSETARWRDKVVDVRNWYSFAAREIDQATGETCSFHEGSSGQSGGEKAKLAFTILVAAIAYQYDLDPAGRTPGRFHFVVVDEMFSKIDDQNAEYALRLFEQFGLQLLIVAPLDAKARVTEPFVDSYLQVVKDEATGRSQLLSMTACEYEQVVEQFAGNGTAGPPRVTAK